MHRAPVTDNYFLGRQSVLLIDHDEVDAMKLANMLRNLGYNTTNAYSAGDGLRMLNHYPSSFDVIILNFNINDMTSIEFIRLVRLMEEMNDLLARPIIVCGENPAIEDIHTCVVAGADNFFYKPYNATLLDARLIAAYRQYDVQKQLKLDSNKLALEARTDPLTGIANRRQYLATIKREAQRAVRQEQPLSLTYFDLDHFKQINDTFGHDTGDTVLKQVCKTISKMLRAEDAFGRLGGEEFSICMPNTSLSQAIIACERYREAIADLVIDSKVGLVKPRASFGVACLDHANDDHFTLLNQADEALYQAKQNGRNQVYSGPQLSLAISANS